MQPTPSITTEPNEPPGPLARLVGRCAFAPMQRLSPVRLASLLCRDRSRAVKRGGELFTFTSHDGLKLEGLRFKGDDSISPRPMPIVIAHGWVEVKEVYTRRALWFAKRGHDVLLFDQRAHGYSTGDVVTFGVREHRDISRLLDHAQAKGWIGDRVIGFGHSMGAACLILCAEHDPRLAALIASAPFHDFRAAIHTWHARHLPMVSLDWAIRGIDAYSEQEGFNLDDSHPRRALDALNIPILLLVAMRDKLLPPDIHGHRLAEALTGKHHRVVHVPRASHHNLCRSRWPEMDQAIERFLDEHAAPADECSKR